MPIIRKTVHIPIEDKTWTAFKILALSRGMSIDTLISELIGREVDAAISGMKDGE